MKKVIVMLAFCLLGVLMFAQERVAVLPFTGGDAGEGDVIARLLGTELTKLGGFDIVPRTNAIDKVMEEHEFQRGGLTDGDTIVALGKAANADYVVSGHIQSLGERKMISASILDVETFQQVSGDHHEYDDISEVRAYLPTLAERLLRNTQKDYSSLPTLAILPFDGVDENNADVLAQLLSIELANSGKYVVVTRTTTIENIMKEQDLQRSGLTDNETISKLGVAMNADYVLVGAVSRLGSDDLMDVQIIDVLSFVQVAGADVDYKTIEEGIELMSELSYDLTGVKGSGSNATVKELEVGLIETVLVEAGNFQMGSTDGEDREKPVHKVTLTSDYYMGKYEVTQGQWYEVMGNKPSSNAPANGWENLPVTNISWYEAIEFCNALSELEGLEPYYSINGTNVTIANKKGKGYRLPTEAEWEYAARGYKYSGSNSIEGVAWYADNSGGKTQEVGTKRANGLGLYDMSGNVWEWCWDWYASYPSGNVTDPTGASTGSNRVLRGGSSYSSADNCRVANRNNNSPSLSSYNYGFRVVRSSLP